MSLKYDPVSEPLHMEGYLANLAAAASGMCGIGSVTGDRVPCSIWSRVWGLGFRVQGS